MPCLHARPLVFYCRQTQTQEVRRLTAALEPALRWHTLHVMLWLALVLLVLAVVMLVLALGDDSIEN